MVFTKLGVLYFSHVPIKFNHIEEVCMLLLALFIVFLNQKKKSSIYRKNTIFFLFFIILVLSFLFPFALVFAFGYIEQHMMICSLKCY